MTPVRSVVDAQVRTPVGLEAIFGSIGTVLVGVAVAAAVLLLVAVFLGERATTGTPSFVSLVSARLSARDGSPVWEAFPFTVALGGLAVALVGWRAYGGGPLHGVAQPLVLVGFGVTLLAGVAAVALAHPPRRMEGQAPDSVAHPVPAHHAGPRSPFAGGPYGGLLVVAGGVLGLVGLPVAVVWRALAGRPVGDTLLPVQVPPLLGAVAMAVGVWLLRAESRGATAAGRPPCRRDAREAAGLTAVLLALSVVADAGAPAAVLAVPAIAALVVARLRLGRGAAVVVAVGYVVGRALVALLTGTPDGPAAVPYALAVLGAALVVEAGVIAAGR